MARSQIRYLPLPPEGGALIVTEGERWTILGIEMTEDGPKMKVIVEPASNGRDCVQILEPFTGGSSCEIGLSSE
jgi:hypothetical protein